MLDFNDFFEDDKKSKDTKPVDRLLQILPRCEIFPDIHININSRKDEKSNLKKILSYEVLSETEWNENEKSFNPNYFVMLDKSDIDNKVKAFLKYRSQTKKFPHPRSKEAIVNLSKVRGSQVFMKYAEAFKVEKILD